MKGRLVFAGALALLGVLAVKSGTKDDIVRYLKIRDM